MALTKFDQISKYGFYIFLGVIIAYLAHIGVMPFVNPDTSQYVAMSPFRSPGYPLFLHLDSFFFGQGHYYPVFLFQLAAGIVASIFAGKTLRDLTNQSDWLGYLFSIIFLIPYFFGDYKFANRLLSEGICYPIYLFGFSNFLVGIVKQQLKSLYIFLGTLFLMVLARPQMVFLYPILFIATLYICSFFKIELRRKIIFSIVALCTVLITNIADRSYHYYLHGHFAKEPTFGFSLAVAPLYLSTLNDARLIKDPKNKALFLQIFDKINKNNANIAEYQHSRASNIYYHFAGSFNPITWHSLYPTFIENGMTDWYEMDKRSLEIAVPLLKAHWQAYFQLCFFAFKQKLGGYYGLLFYSLVLCLSFVSHIRSKDQLSLILFFVTLTAFANYSSVALVEVILRRYSSYTESFQLCSMIAIVLLCLKPYLTSKDKLLQMNEPTLI